MANSSKPQSRRSIPKPNLGGIARPNCQAGESVPNINAPGALGIYDGQQRAGTVVRQGEEFFAFDADGKCVGVFDTMIEASRKIPPVRARETAP